MNRSYKILPRQSYQKGDYAIVPIREEDKYLIMQWRNEQMYHLRQNSLLTREQQDQYFDTVISKLFDQKQPEQILFSYLYQNQCVGYGGLVHINWEEKKAEISFIMATELERTMFDKHWTIFLGLIEKVAFRDLKLDKLFTYAYDLRPHLYPVLEQNGFKLAQQLKNQLQLDNQFVDVYIHEKINPATLLQFREVTARDEKLLFDWANDPLVRQQSFQSDPIDYKTHQKWFQRKIKDEKSLLLIAEIEKKPVSLVRFDMEETHAVIGISIDALWRGRSLAVPILKKASHFFIEKYRLPIYAYIKQTNEASIQAFKKADYKFDAELLFNGAKSFLYILKV